MWPPRPTAIPRILPFDARYALSEKKARMGKSEILALLRSDFSNEALYLLMKGLARSPEQQHMAIERVSTLLMEHDIHAPEVRQFLEEKVQSLDDSVSVAAAKLAQLSRQDFDWWDEQYRNIAMECLQDGKIPILISAATLIGLSHFLRVLNRLGMFYLLVLDWIEDDFQLYSGYRFLYGEKGGVHVELLEKIPHFCRNVLVIDDTIHTGAHLAKTLRHLHVCGSGEVPTRVICHVTPC